MITVLETCDYTVRSKNSGDYITFKGNETFLRKVYSPGNVVTNAPMAARFRLRRSYGDFETLAKLEDLLISLAGDPHACIIRNEYVSAEIGDVVYRRAVELNLTKHRNLCIDVDTLKLPEHIQPTDITAQGKYVMQVLSKCCPDFFSEDTGFLACASSSSGVSKEYVKLHLWFLNKSPISQQQLKNAMYKVNTEYKKVYQTDEVLVDQALFSVAQIHYTADPIFNYPLVDPYKNKKRIIRVDGVVSQIPASMPEWVNIIRATTAERSEYMDNIVGSLKPNKATEQKLETVRSWPPSRSGLRQAVLSLYHEALQTQYNIERLDKEVLSILNYSRPGQGEDYISQAKNNAMDVIKSHSGRAIDTSVLGLDIKTLSGGSHSRFLQVEAFPRDTAVFLKASLGTGKTATIERMLHNGRIGGTFLAITDTSALVEANCVRFDAADFREGTGIQDLKQGRINRLSGTLHSLSKLEGMQFDFVFIDEADSVMDNLLFASIITEPNRLRIAGVLSHIMKKAKRVVLSDGDLSQETVHCYTTLMGGEKRIAKIEHNRKNLRNIPAYRHKSAESVWGAVEGAISVGEKCLVVTDNGPNKLNIYQDVLRRVHPELNIEVAHANSKFDEVTKDIILNTTEALKRRDIDCLICSPSITSGVDFNYFDTVFVITSTQSHSPNMRFQALMRERSPKEIHYYISPLVRGFTTGYSNLGIDLDWVNESRKRFASRKEREYRLYGATFNYYLIKAGCKIGYMDESYKCPKTKEDEDAYYDERAYAVVTAAEGVTVARHNDAFRMKNLLQDLWEISEPTFEEARQFIIEDPPKKLTLFHSIVEEFWDVLKYNDPELLKGVLQGPRGNTFYLMSGLSLSSKPARAILDDCGLVRNIDINKFIAMYKRFCMVSALPIPSVLASDEVTFELGEL